MTQYFYSQSLAEATLLKIKAKALAIKKKLLENTKLNESFNNGIWEQVPKTKFVSLKKLHIEIMDTVINLNDGILNRIKVSRLLVFSECKMEAYLRKIDKVRICEAEFRVPKV